MKVVFDHQTFTLQNYGGISRYFYELNREFKSYPDMQCTTSLIFSNNEYIKDNEVISSFPFFPNIKFRGKLKMMYSLNTWVSKRIYQKNQFDVFHPTYYDPYFLKLKSTKPFVVTCLDLIHEKFIQDDVTTLRNKKIILERADKIIAISQNTKNDILEYYPIPENKIAVVHLASALKSLPENKSLIAPEKKFLLYVGTRSLYKNFMGFVKAIAPLLVTNHDLFLYCAGGGDFNAEEKKLLNELKVSLKVQLHPASDESLQHLYAHALAFFYPSKYEGFGIPLVEAMNCGCPIAASNSSSLPEVAGEAALYFNPNDGDSMYAAAENLYKNNQIRSDLKQKGFLRAKEFSWKRTAQQTHQVYKEMI